MLGGFFKKSKIKMPKAQTEDRKSESASEGSESGVQRSFVSESRLPRPASRSRILKEKENSGTMMNTPRMSRQTSACSDVSMKDTEVKDNKCDEKSTPRRLFDAIGDSGNQETDNVQVVVRIRPMSMAEQQQGVGNCCVVDPYDRSSITIRTLPEHHTYTFDRVAGQDETQSGLFDMLGKPIVENVLSGYNSCIFAYGQTGSGKTYTMLGEQDSNGSLLNSSLRGLTPRLFELLFQRMEEEQAKKGQDNLKFCVKCSFLEIYNESVADLLEPADGTSGSLQIREDLSLGIHVAGLSEHNVFNVTDAVALLQHGADNRRQGETNMNDKSSRSHAVFTCILESKYIQEDGLEHIYSSRLNLVDLAGSERQDKSGAVGERLREASHINKSLTRLGYVINCLVELQHGRRSHVPYRDSKLTFLLQDSLGGNSKTIMIANVSPAMSNVQETLSTVRFASRAKKIKNKAVVNEDTSGDARLLREEIVRLNREIHKYRTLAQQQQQQQQQHGQYPVTPERYVRSPFATRTQTDTADIATMTEPFEEQFLVGELRNQLQKISSQRQVDSGQIQDLQREVSQLRQLYLLNRRYYRKYLDYKDRTLRGWRDGLLGNSQQQQQSGNSEAMVIDDMDQFLGEKNQLTSDTVLEDLFQLRQALLDFGDDPDSDTDAFNEGIFGKHDLLKEQENELLQKRYQEEFDDNKRAYQRIEQLISDNHGLQQTQLRLEKDISEMRREKCELQMQLQQQMSPLVRVHRALKIRHSSGGVSEAGPHTPSQISSPFDTESVIDRYNQMASTAHEKQIQNQQLAAEKQQLQFKVQELEQDADNYASYVDDLKEQISKLQRQLNQALQTQQIQSPVRDINQENLQTECELLQAQKEELGAQVQAQNTQIEELRYQIETNEREKVQLKTLQEKILQQETINETLAAEVHEYRLQVEQLQEQCDQFQDYNTIKGLCSAYQEELETVKQQHLFVQQSHQELQIQLDSQSQQLQLVSGERDQLLVEKREVQHQLEASQQDSRRIVEDLRQNIRDLKEQLENQNRQVCQQMEQTQQDGKVVEDLKFKIRTLEEQLNNQSQYFKRQMETTKINITQEAGKKIHDLKKQLQEQTERCNYFQMNQQEVQEQMQERMQEELQVKESQLMGMGVELRETQRQLQDSWDELKQVNMQLASCKEKYNTLLDERKKFLVKIQEFQSGMDSAISSADSEMKRANVLDEQVKSYRLQLDTQCKQIQDLQNELSILSGQQNTNQRIQHVKKLKDENNNLMGQISQLQTQNGKLQYKNDRLLGEVRRLRQIKDGEQYTEQMDIDEELNLRDQLQRMETEKLRVMRGFQQFAQSLSELLSSQTTQAENKDENTPPPNSSTIFRPTPSSKRHDFGSSNNNVNAMEFEDLKQFVTETMQNIHSAFLKKQQRLWLQQEQMNLLQLQKSSQ